FSLPPPPPQARGTGKGGYARRVTPSRTDPQQSTSPCKRNTLRIMHEKATRQKADDPCVLLFC
ncbi:hypothetical protein COCVIDRAFT_86008, partial [Bipolaris victoriae FI3]